VNLALATSVGSRMPNRPLRSLLALVLALSLTGSAFALDVGARLPDIGMRDLNGRAVTAESLRGKVVLVDFWASWCAPCREEMPVLQRLHEKYSAQGLVIVGVSVDRDASKAREFASRLGITFPLVHDAQHTLAGRFSPPKMPSSYVVDRRGVTRYVHAGFRASDAATMEREIKALLAQ